MKKIILLCAMLASLLALTACSSEPCEICGDTPSSSHTIAGESVNLCSDCYSAAKDLASAFF